ncbi:MULTISPECIES: YlmC/YmxH family sporulation protein [Pontibacillus]|uniref:YlmC/YmxH family sporulation protein n=1 Tax=Pontibacillus chungwhensis TaxID=265426 RepID=A0ABY8V4E3_9BACI|nr:MULTISPECIES: YlmC/YmxH family sporulation protein [Pontibacillus]MCD5322602.1 YlmC/YmxH family sporulation protein [Pontibacillus sp. HN14]WIF99886.1 YlmC/YmxH family sporulation protein [Pontibacillus chungwhensis]
MVTISELQVKEIISVENGQKIGHMTDLEIDVDKGKLLAIVVGTKGKMMGLFGKDDEMVIPWSSILTIGEDVILVKNVTRPALYPPEKPE